ncbi:hypothetical protein [Clostridium fungisolvens]|uniref:Uncharacterized protein n=1 Tax=Clostridium fungisolvens TaxID=1604897 RepID=A0A6V8SM91_9CLOT|nr:hypothetical protein [Clostridium fungisolvens]GFP78349.1 hypothetical protein bsdtw1_04569 [Clostridium fungisolvens]
MRKIKFVWIVFCLFIICLISISLYPAIPRPDEIVVHKMQKSITISKQDKRYNEILTLTNKRFTIRNAQSDISNSEKESFIKNSSESLEFIYNRPQSYRSKKGFIYSITYDRLFFPIESSDKIESTYVFFGSSNGYYNITVKDLLKADKLVDTLKDIN